MATGQAVETRPAFDHWCIVELMGHVRLAGRVTEEERFGCKMGRIDVPRDSITCPDCNGERAAILCASCSGKGAIEAFTTQYFGGSSVYRITPCSEAAARAVARSSQPAPVHSWELPQALPSPDRTMPCGHTPEDCDCELPDDFVDHDL